MMALICQVRLHHHLDYLLRMLLGYRRVPPSVGVGVGVGACVCVRACACVRMCICVSGGR